MAFQISKSYTGEYTIANTMDMAIAIETFRAGAKDYVAKGHDSWDKISSLIDSIIIRPIRIVVKGFFG